jgi:N-acetylglucosamine-6-sulfatase
VDESLGEMMELLQSSGQLDRTLIVVTSDHGYFYGEHGLSVERRLAYEEGIRIPLFMRLPGLIKAGSKPSQMVLTLDLAPTILEMAQAAPLAGMQGRSLAPILRGESPEWREDFLVEYYSDKVFPRIDRMGYQTVRNARWKWIHYVDLTGMDELYDLANDPFEMQNRIADPAATGNLQSLQKRLTILLQESQAPLRN